LVEMCVLASDFLGPGQATRNVKNLSFSIAGRRVCP
jgi:hypothetical protein